MIALVTMGLSSAKGTNYSYWAYIANPPINQVIHWLSERIPIYVNDSNWTPGPYDTRGPLRPGEEGVKIETYLYSGSGGDAHLHWT